MVRICVRAGTSNYDDSPNHGADYDNTDHNAGHHDDSCHNNAIVASSLAGHHPGNRYQQFSPGSGLNRRNSFDPDCDTQFGNGLEYGRSKYHGFAPGAGREHCELDQYVSDLVRGGNIVGNLWIQPGSIGRNSRWNAVELAGEPKDVEVIDG
jgi:hypothetical protein